MTPWVGIEQAGMQVPAHLIQPHNNVLDPVTGLVPAVPVLPYTLIEPRPAKILYKPCFVLVECLAQLFSLNALLQYCSNSGTELAILLFFLLHSCSFSYILVFSPTFLFFLLYSYSFSYIQVVLKVLAPNWCAHGLCSAMEYST
jgi:hypothetical protein